MHITIDLVHSDGECVVLSGFTQEEPEMVAQNVVIRITRGSAAQLLSCLQRAHEPRLSAEVDK